MTNEFELTYDDIEAIGIANDVARLLLEYKDITPQQIIGLGNALYALEQLPSVTNGAYCEFGVILQEGDSDFREMRYIDFKISEESFAIIKGGSTYERAIGSDSYSEPGWIVEVGGYRNADCELYNLKESIREYLNLGASISVNDESDIEME